MADINLVGLNLTSGQMQPVGPSDTPVSTAGSPILGSTGIEGTTGIQGLSGNTGTQGIAGLTGVIGLQGITDFKGRLASEDQQVFRVS